MSRNILAVLALAAGIEAAPQNWSPYWGHPAWYQSQPLYPTPSGFVGPTGTSSSYSLVASDSGIMSILPVSTPIAEPSATASDSGSLSTLPLSTSIAEASSSSYSSIPVATNVATLSSSFSSSSGGSLPASSGSSALSSVQTIAAGESFDGGMYMYDRGVSCTGQEEGGASDAVFEIEEGGSLSNVIIGPNQIEGVHCFGDCTLTNIWWSAVCEDAFTVKEQSAGSTTTINGGGAFGAEDKIVQHNGGGTISITGFTIDNFGKLYRSCGNCDSMYERHVIMDDITATEGKTLAGINSNYGDTATLSNIKVSNVNDICVTYTGNDNGDEPEENGSGPSDFCIYDDSDITET